MMTAFNHLNVGLRYLLPVLPFVYVLLGAVWTRWGRGARVAAAAALAYTALSSQSVHPSELAYFNRLSGGPANGHRWLLDSNLDWGQDLYRLRPELEQRGLEGPISLLYFGHVDPALYGIEYELLPSQPKPGILAVSVTYLAGFKYPALTPDGHNVLIREDHAEWLREREPIARLGSLWLFDTRSDAADAPR